MSVDMIEFFSIAKFNHGQQEFRILFEDCSNNLNDDKAKKKLLTYFQKLEKGPSKSLGELRNFISIKNYYH